MGQSHLGFRRHPSKRRGLPDMGRAHWHEHCEAGAARYAAERSRQQQQQRQRLGPLGGGRRLGGRRFGSVGVTIELLARGRGTWPWHAAVTRGPGSGVETRVSQRVCRHEAAVLPGGQRSGRRCQMRVRGVQDALQRATTAKHLRTVRQWERDRRVVPSPRPCGPDVSLALLRGRRSNRMRMFARTLNTKAQCGGIAV